MRDFPPYPECAKVWGDRDVPEDVGVVVAIDQLVLLISQCADTRDSSPRGESYDRYQSVLSMDTLLQTASFGDYSYRLVIFRYFFLIPEPTKDEQWK